MNVKLERGKSANVREADPESARQVVQWQICTLDGREVDTYDRARQWQEPRRIGFPVVDIVSPLGDTSC